MKRTFLTSAILAALFGAGSTLADAQFLGPQQVNELPSTPTDHRIAYGSGPQQFGELRLPAGRGRHPVAVVIHGGCWKAVHGPLTADLKNTAPLASALTARGIATWNIEYRSTDHPDGGWPGTYEDIAKAVDHLRVLRRAYPLDLDRVIIVGHSAGGHLGTWAAARYRLTRKSTLFSHDPLRIMGIVNLAAPLDLEDFFRMRPDACAEGVYTGLLGGPLTGPVAKERFNEISPAELLPIRVPQILITGADDKVVAPEFAQRYEEKARRAGDKVTSKTVANAAHFEVIAPGSVAWPVVEDAVLSILGVKKRTSSRKYQE